MSYFAVIGDYGPARDPSKGLRDQPMWTEHAAFMDALFEEDFVVVAGPLGDGSSVLVIVDAADEAEVERRLAEDPWRRIGMLMQPSVKSWRILLGDLKRESPDALWTTS